MALVQILPKELEGKAQRMACLLSARLGYPKTATKLKVARTTVWSWARGETSPSVPKYRDLEVLYKEIYESAER